MRRHAFTLIELLVVIAIIGILSALVITQLGNSSIKARNAAAQSDVVEMGKAVESFRTDDTASGAVVSNISGTVDTLNGTYGTLPNLFKGIQSTTSLTYAAAVTKTPSASYTYRYYTSSVSAGGTRQLVQAAPSQPEYVLCSNLINAPQPSFCTTEGSSPQQGTDQVKAVRGLIAWYQLDGNGTNTSAPDTSGYGISGSLQNFTFDNTTNGWTSGKIGGALLFNGTNDYIDAGNDPSIQLSTGTISAWIKTSNAGSGYRGIIVKQNAYGIFTLNNSVAFYDWGGTGNNITSVRADDNSWHLVTLTFQSGVANGTTAYFDGAPILTARITVSNQTTNAQIGGGGNPSPAQTFSGLIDDARIYNRSLSATEVQQLYQGTL